LITFFIVDVLALFIDFIGRGGFAFIVIDLLALFMNFIDFIGEIAATLIVFIDFIGFLMARMTRFIDFIDFIGFNLGMIEIVTAVIRSKDHSREIAWKMSTRFICWVQFARNPPEIELRATGKGQGSHTPTYRNKMMGSSSSLGET